MCKIIYSCLFFFFARICIIYTYVCMHVHVYWIRTRHVCNVYSMMYMYYLFLMYLTNLNIIRASYTHMPGCLCKCMMCQACMTRMHGHCTCHICCLQCIHACVLYMHWYTYLPAPPRSDSRAHEMFCTDVMYACTCICNTNVHLIWACGCRRDMSCM
jgi:hypothetical protein